MATPMNQNSLGNFFDQGGKKVNEAIEKKGGDLLGLESANVEGAEQHSGAYIGPGQKGVTRTLFYTPTENPNPSPGQQNPTQQLDDESGNKWPAGFTPIMYYRADNGDVHLGSMLRGGALEPGEGLSGALKVTSPQSRLEDNIRSWEKFEDYQSVEFKYPLSGKLKDPSYYVNMPGQVFPNNDLPDYYFDGGDGSQATKPWTKGITEKMRISQGTPFENEDPVYFGFEVEIDALNSPIINGQTDLFLRQFDETYEGMYSRKDILDSFIYELSRFFSFNTSKPIESRSSMFLTTLPKRHYVKKISGLEKLSESNTPTQQSAFTKYKTDTIKLTFYEDTNLSTGTLASLYKLLYWDRLRGKNMIPENLLKFDCRIVISEARNVARIRRALGTPEPNLEVIKENVSRYVYNVYECQLFFSKMTHPDTIDMSTSPSFTSDFDIEMSYKYSTMKFERFVFDNKQTAQTGKYKTLNNILDNPLKIRPIDTEIATITGGGILPLASETQFIILQDVIDGYNGFSTSEEEGSSPEVAAVVDDNPGLPPEEEQLTRKEKRQQRRAERRAERSSKDTLPDTGSGGGASSLPDDVGSQKPFKPPSDDTLESAKEEDKKSKFKEKVKDNKGKFKEAIGDSSKGLLGNLKKAGLNEAQRQINNKFRLINDTVSSIRQAFGAGQISPPTNVYEGSQPGQLGYEVQNSLRNFVGDTLTNTIFPKNLGNSGESQLPS